MTLEEALRFIDPETDMDALAEVEYYGGLKGKEQAAQKLKEASRMVVDFIRRVSWHDAKTPPPVHDESWENAGGKALLHHERTCVGLLRKPEHHEGLD